MKKRVAGLFISLICLFALSACSSSSNSSENKDKQLVMGTSGDYPPFEYVDTANGEEIIGFDADLAKALGGKTGYEITVKDMDFNGLITSLQSGKVDFVMAGMEATPERKKNADFTEPYFRSDISMVVDKKSGIKTVEDIKGKVVGVQVGSIQAEKAKELQKIVDFQLETRDRVPDLVQEINSGRFDGVLMEDVVSKGYLEKNDNLTTISVPSNETGGAAIAFQKDSELTSKFNDALKEMKENGEMDKLVAKWFNGEKSLKIAE
ncbi:transporter substrate-binding domain-containing protein [Niallia nealsonii]|uniref:ABC transporter substrate-binding protein n=1 Tax=Niallia nealsonii TaxID=115979 RepID=A0A2N0Z5S8_9BACI|nr:transporter substrate-binding domain-containing protein [Niallia nealsonii]PKG24862.1 ABC transporter substrate-binding protein [Niallia nealsonii]